MEFFSLETNLENDLNNMRKYYESGKTKEASWRESQLKGLRNFVIENEEKILKSLKKDLGKHHVEAFRDEVGILKRSIDLAIKSFRKWMSAKEAKLPQIALLSSAEIVAEPLGLVLIISSWNFPF
ncbi:aldehyde dehydrogenase family 3 member f1-like protein, partial [Trifolium pratense]